MRRKFLGTGFRKTIRVCHLRRLHNKCGRFFVEKEEQIQFLGFMQARNGSFLPGKGRTRRGEMMTR